MRHLLMRFCVVLAATVLLHAQQFDVASVRRTAPGPPYGGYRHQLTPTGITLHRVSLGYCIRVAWGLKYAYDLVGPGWLDPPTDILVDITAKTAEPATEAQVLKMLQSLLAQRFKLAAHLENRQLATYSLVLIRKNPALRPSHQEAEPKMKSGSKPYSDAFQNFTMTLLARHLSPPVTSRPVQDKTGLSGTFDFEIDMAPYVLDADGKPIVDHRGAIDSEGANMQALRDQLGLALKADHALFPVLVVDHVEKTPTGN